MPVLMKDDEDKPVQWLAQEQFGYRRLYSSDRRDFLGKNIMLARVQTSVSGLALTSLERRVVQRRGKLGR